jgi:hypothetical protein
MSYSKTKKTTSDESQIQKRFILHPPHTQPANLKNRIICQLISSVKGRVKMYGHKDNDDCVVFEGTKAEEMQIQYLTDVHVSGFWERVEILYKEYVEEHDLYCKEEGENAPAVQEGNIKHLRVNAGQYIHRK